jgi:diketogulonate reductase-like aldo/keto reductase
LSRGSRRSGTKRVRRIPARPAGTLAADVPRAKIARMHPVLLPNGAQVPALGLGTWRLGESRTKHADDVNAVRLALDLGYRLIDTAEMYGDGGAERVVGEALSVAVRAGALRREDVFLVTKVLPSNASRKGTVAACERSLQRLGVEHVDLYLLHWRGGHPLAETVAAFQSLRERGLIRAWGVSNFDVDDIEELWAVDGGPHCVVNQVYYSASERGIEFDLLPAQRKRGVATMAYCPIDQGALAGDATFAEIGQRHGVSAAQAALAWVLRQPDVIAIPKAARASHLRENIAAADLTLTDRDLATVDARFPPPKRKRRLAVT